MTNDEVKKKFEEDFPGVEVHIIGNYPKDLTKAAQETAEWLDELVKLQDPSAVQLPEIAWRARIAWKRYRELERKMVKEATEPLPKNFIPGKGGAH